MLFFGFGFSLYLSYHQRFGIFKTTSYHFPVLIWPNYFIYKCLGCLSCYRLCYGVCLLCLCPLRRQHIHNKAILGKIKHLYRSATEKIGNGYLEMNWKDVTTWLHFVYSDISYSQGKNLNHFSIERFSLRNIKCNLL